MASFLPSFFTPDVNSGEEKVLGCSSCWPLTSLCLAAEQDCGENPIPDLAN